MRGPGRDAAAFLAAADEADDVEEPVPVRAQHQVVASRGPDPPGDVLALVAGGGGVALPQVPGGVDLALGAGLGIDQLDHADVGQGQLPGVDDLDGEDLVARGQAPQRTLPAPRGQEVRHHDHEAAAALPRPSQGVDGGGQVDTAPTGGGRGEGGGVQGAQQVPSPGAGGQDAHVTVARHHHAEAVAGAQGDEADGGGGGQGHVPLLTRRGAEVEAGRAVEQDPRGQFPVGDGLAHVDLGHPGRDVPVDAADVVARRVGAGVAGLTAPARDETLEVTVQHPVEPAGDVDLQAAQDLLGRRTRDPGWGRARGAHPARAGATGAAGTVERTRTRTSFTSTPSARAS